MTKLDPPNRGSASKRQPKGSQVEGGPHFARSFHFSREIGDTDFFFNLPIFKHWLHFFSRHSANLAISINDNFILPFPWTKS